MRAVPAPPPPEAAEARGLGWRGAALAGALLAGTAVALGAFGAHLIGERLSVARLATFETAVRYQMFHGLGLLALAALRRPTGPAAALLLAGTLVFSGSLYLLVATGTGLWGAVTPLGGVLLLAGWATLAWRVAHAPR